MSEHRLERLQWGLIVAMAAAAAYALVQLPPGARVATHFNAQMQADGWSDAATALWLLPGLALALRGLQALLPRIDPRADNLRRSARAVGTVFAAGAQVLAAFQALIVGVALGWWLPRPGFGLVVLGLMLAFVGNVMGKLRPNATVGIRTPWTLADDRVWERTHRVGGRWMVAAGLLLALLPATPLPTHWYGPAVLLLALLPALAATGCSWWLWRALPRAGGHG
ncbi:SdpI family protein [Aquabacterium sp. OR-4]|uniref:SdpI family protein n=1 Tax=Aquabacterium sp. OR-4 TaxID=2978127 RepID=UPI0021B34491|nr:SdpI family protein [Aquabacterium sp. OR-4]MDT7837530.1 SdpI family protein [Aquabacterium sp. OR-4]